MDQQKKFSVFDIVNICILGIGVVLMVISIIASKPIEGDAVASVVRVISYIASIVALISAIAYMIMRYTKKAAFFYKVFMFAFVAVSAILALVAMTVGSNNMLGSILIIAILLLSVLLASAKDYGKVKTFIIAGILLTARIILVITGTGAAVQVLPFIINLVLTAEACIMVLAKYHDKDSRGAK